MAQSLENGSSRGLICLAARIQKELFARGGELSDSMVTVRDDFIGLLLIQKPFSYLISPGKVVDIWVLQVGAASEFDLIRVRLHQGVKGRYPGINSFVENFTIAFKLDSMTGSLGMLAEGWDKFYCIGAYSSR